MPPTDPSLLAIIGASGHGKVICDAAERSVLSGSRTVGGGGATVGQSGWHVVGFLDSGKETGTECLGLTVLGRVEEVAELAARFGFSACVVAVGDNAVRRDCVERIRQAWPEVEFATIIHPGAIVAGDAEIGAGTVILAGAIVNPGCRIGSHCILNTGSQLDHDCVMGDFAALGPRVATGGTVRIGEGSIIGVGASIIHGITIGEETVVGAGAVVVRDVPDHVVAYGNPARVVRKRRAGDKYL